MDALTIQQCPAAAIRLAATFEQLSAEYAQESLIDGMHPAPDWNAYAELEASGAFYAFGAGIDGCLVGFLGMLVTKVPRYAAPIATVEGFFVGAVHRKSGAGLKLLRAAEAKAAGLGCAGVFCSAPVRGRLAAVLPRSGYRETSRVFFREASSA